MVQERNPRPTARRLVAYYKIENPESTLADLRQTRTETSKRRPVMQHRMPRLILHAGWHKTATKAIQLFAYRNRDELRRRGLWYPEFPGTGRSGNRAHLRLARAVSADSRRNGSAQAARVQAIEWAAAAASSGETV